MKIHYFARVFNEERLIPYVFRHYDDIVDNYFIWDHASTDNTKKLLLENPKVTVFDLPDSLFDDEELRIFKNTAFKQFSDCDFAIIADFDEMLYNPNLLNLLEDYKKQGVTVIRTEGYQMYADEFPNTDKQIYEVVRSGKREPLYDKSIIINPNINPNYSYGAHYINPTGPVKYSNSAEVKLLHYKVFGESFINQMIDRNERLSCKNKSLGLSVYSLNPNDRFNPRNIYEDLKNNSTIVI